MLNYITGMPHAVPKLNNVSFVCDSSLRNSCLHSTFSKTGNKYMLLSYFHALKNPTAVSIVQFVF